MASALAWEPMTRSAEVAADAPGPHLAPVPARALLQVDGVTLEYATN